MFTIKPMIPENIIIPAGTHKHSISKPISTDAAPFFITEAKYIIATEINLSRFKVTLKDVSIVNKEGIQKLGAKGIVEIDNQLKIILGSESKQLKKYIDDLK